MSHAQTLKGNSFLYKVIFEARIFLNIASVDHMGNQFLKSMQLDSTRMELVASLVSFLNYERY